MNKFIYYFDYVICFLCDLITHSYEPFEGYIANEKYRDSNLITCKRCKGLWYITSEFNRIDSTFFGRFRK